MSEVFRGWVLLSCQPNDVGSIAAMEGYQQQLGRLGYSSTELFVRPSLGSEPDERDAAIRDYHARIREWVLTEGDPLGVIIDAAVDDAEDLRLAAEVATVFEANGTPVFAHQLGRLTAYEEAHPPVSVHDSDPTRDFIRVFKGALSGELGGDIRGMGLGS